MSDEAGRGDEKTIQNALDEAVREFSANSGFEGLLTNYVIVMTHATFRGDDEATSYAMTFMSGTAPYYTSLGLLEYAKHRLLTDAMSGPDE